MFVALYIHFPFCIQKCLYCDFNSVADSRIAPADYTAALLREMELRRETLADQVSAPTLYFGGGTPSLLEPKLVALLIEAAAEFYGLAAGAEITIEANPGTVTRERLAAYRAAGVNRLSLGVQSFNDSLLQRLGRVHSAAQALAAFEAARSAGFANVGVDLIHSLPGQDPALWLAELERAVALAPEHISAYGLTIEEGTPFHALARGGELALPGEEEAAGMFEETATVLGEAGYEHYEISNFARSGCRSRHNQVYWCRESYLGFGAGAHSFLATPRFGRRWHNPERPELYLQTLESGLAPQEGLTAPTEREAKGERLFLGLRMMEGVDGELFREEFGVSIVAAYPAELPGLLAEGLLEWEGGRLRLSRRGILLANQVFMRFV
jgi:oxygen-independent coproporphyrinogen III oxidase